MIVIKKEEFNSLSAFLLNIQRPIKIEDKNNELIIDIEGFTSTDWFLLGKNIGKSLHMPQPEIRPKPQKKILQIKAIYVKTYYAIVIFLMILLVIIFFNVHNINSISENIKEIESTANQQILDSSNSQMKKNYEWKKTIHPVNGTLPHR